MLFDRIYISYMKHEGHDWEGKREKKKNPSVSGRET